MGTYNSNIPDNIKEILASYFDDPGQFTAVMSSISAFLRALGAQTDYAHVRKAIDGRYEGYERDVNWLKVLCEVFAALTDIRKSLSDEIVTVLDAFANMESLPREEINSIRNQIFKRFKSDDF